MLKRITLTILLLINMSCLLCQEKEVQPYKVLSGHEYKIMYLGYSQDGKYLISGGWDNKVLIWKISALLKIENPDHGFISTEPASRWEESLICGNGTIGLTMPGDAVKDRIIFGHERLFMPEYQPYEAPDLGSRLPEIREAIFNGRNVEAAEIMAEEITIYADILVADADPVDGYNAICSAGELPPTLQGIWGGIWCPMWSGDYTLNGNVPSAVALGLNSNLLELTDSYLNLG